MGKFSNRHAIDIEYSALTLESEMINYLKQHRLDCCVFLAIENDKVIRLLSIKKDQDVAMINRYTEFFNFKEHKFNGFFEMVKAKEAVTNEKKSAIESYIKDIGAELYIPITHKEKISGCVYLCAKETNIEIDDFSQLEEIIKRHLLYIHEIKAKKIIDKVMIEHIILLNKAFDEKNMFMTKHSYNVALWSIDIAAEMNYNEAQIVELYMAALMHDIGKIYLDTEIVNKEGKYTEEEYGELKRHAKLGYNISKDLLIASHSQIPLWIEQHHERWDGKGYPKGLIGEQIEEQARILKMADALDSMLTLRNYKSQMNINECIEEIKRCRGKDFEPKIVDAVIKILSKRLNLKHENVNEYLLPANLIVATQETVINIDGHVLNANGEMLFTTKQSSNALEQDNVSSVVLALERLGVIHEYRVNIRQTELNTYLIEEIKIKDDDEAFSLLWRLKAYLINIQTKESKEIDISRISASGITFTMNENEKISNTEMYGVAVPFEDGTKLTIIGKVVNLIIINQTCHYEMVFAGIKEKTKAEIYRQMFKKQIEIRKQLK